MFVIVWATLLFSVRGSNVDSGASLWGESSHCLSDSCIKLNGGEITAEAGLCAVIPCSFIPPSTFQTTDLAWMKCKPSKQKCDQSDWIFHTEKSRKVQSRFEGRVSLLEPNVSLRNCSIIINDLTESDSGSYQLRIVGTTNNIGDGLTFPERTNVSVKDLTQKPTMMIPPLTAGQQTTLTCIAPGLCSGSEPEITWMWRGEGGKHIKGNITAFKTESLTSVTQRHSSTLTFNASAEHHGTKVTCKVSFINNISTEETVTLNVTDPVQQYSAMLSRAVAAVALIFNVLRIICLILLWNTKQKVRPKQEDRTYISLQRKDTSPEYDVTGQPRS